MSVAAKLAEGVERLIREKIISEYKNQHGYVPDLNATHTLQLGGEDIQLHWEETTSYKEFIREIMREFHCGLLELATEDGVYQV